MLWYVNDASLQGQFQDFAAFERIFRELLALRLRNPQFRTSLRTTQSLSQQPVTFSATLRNVVQESRDKGFKIQVLGWLEKTGPFIEGDRLWECDDYFECLSLDVTDGGLGEAARRVKSGESASSFSFEGGPVDFSFSPLQVDHGLAGERLGAYHIQNTWTIEGLTGASVDRGPVNSWKTLIESAQLRFRNLFIPDSIYKNPALARETFESAIGNQALTLLGHLNEYMIGRLPGGAESPSSRHIYETFFTGDRAPFTGESETNERRFRKELTFVDPEDGLTPLFAPWHGKISRRFFRMHFEWPVPATASKLKILYLGPKITKG